MESRGVPITKYGTQPQATERRSSTHWIFKSEEMGNAKKDYKDIKEESKQLYDLLKMLKVLQEEKTNVESKVLKEQLNARFISFYNSSKNKSRKDDDGRSAVAPIDSLRSRKAPTFFAAVANNRRSQRAHPPVSPDINVKLEGAKRAVEDKVALLCKSNTDSLALKNVGEEWMRDIGIKLERAYLDEESSVAMWRYFNVSTITKEFWGQIGRGDVMLGSRIPPFMYVEARCSQTVELRVTPDVRIRFKTTQFDQERSTTLWRELCDSPAINSVLDRVITNGRVVSEGGEHDVKFQIAMWAESGADFNSAWERLKNATVVSTSSNSEKNIVEVAVHQGVSISVEGFLFEANTNLPLNNNSTMFNNNGRQSISSDGLEWVHPSMENDNKTYNNESIQSSHNNTTLNYDKSCDSFRRSCSGVTQIPEVALDCSGITTQRNVEPIAVFMMRVSRHTNSHQLQESFK